jgi:hypothetical protein
VPTFRQGDGLPALPEALEYRPGPQLLHISRLLQPLRRRNDWTGVWLQACPWLAAGDGCQVLKITVIEGGAEKRLKVEGKVAEPWVSELESAWNQARRASHTRRIEVDLSGMTFIDARGEAALTTMIADGARLTAAGVYCKYVVEQLVTRALKSHVLRQGKAAGESQSGFDQAVEPKVQPRSIKERH